MSLIKSTVTYLSNPEQRKFYIALSVVFLIAAILRFYNLGEIQALVFDEVYFPDYGYSYLAEKEFFHVHPPLYSYISMASIWLYYQLPWVDSVNFSQIALTDLNSLSYRWMNALFGSLLSLVVALAAYRLTHVRTFAVLAGLFVAIDGSIIVDSRFGMNNIFLILFGFLGVWCAAKAHLEETHYKHRWFAAAGIFLGCCICIKWNGLGYIMALIALLLGALVVSAFDRYRPVRAKMKEKEQPLNLPFRMREYALYLAVIPTVIYCLLWIPDRAFNTEYSFIGIHKQILGYHSTMVSADQHPYCSKWYEWPIMERPISYFFETREAMNDAGEMKKYFRDIHLFGNPAIYWLSTLAILAMVIQWLRYFYIWFSTGNKPIEWLAFTAILLGYFGNLMPWSLINRCAFLYHYQSAAVFSFLALAWYLAKALKSEIKWLKGIGIFILVLIGCAFVYWLPFVLGLELSSETYYQRMWFRSWI